MKRLVWGIFISLFCVGFFSITAFANITGPHNIPHRKGVCNNCHVPHNAKGKRIWARNLSENFGGVRQLCNSCHDGTLSQSINPDDPNSQASSGIMSVFGSQYETHVMHAVANINGETVYYDEEFFVLDPNDTDNAHPGLEGWDRGGEGFYCGSCHNVHKQPEGNETNGDYLRAKTGDVGEPGNRAPFCRQCHDPVKKQISHFYAGKCEACHHPHEGYKKADATMKPEELEIIRLTLRQAVAKGGVRFKALPNVPEITEDIEDISKLPASFCYGCHQPYHILNPALDFTDPNYDAWIETGAAPIYGDLVKGTENMDHKKNHHPMGSEARLTGDVFLRAIGTPKEHLNINNELTCISCHADLHGTIDGKSYDQSKENNFLRWDFSNDNSQFCIQCHIDKEFLADGKHFFDANSPISRQVFDKTAPDSNYEKSVSCRQCMFCHFIHDGTDGDSWGLEELSNGTVAPYVDTLMRVKPENLQWADKTQDNSYYDYEDMCFGCHGRSDLVYKTADDNSLLKPESYFSHRFSCLPDPNSATSENLIIKGVHPISDGTGISILNDYGTKAGHIFCGSCHNVHDSRKKPYLDHTHVAFDLSLEDGFCESCHEYDSGAFGHMSHPLYEGPREPATKGYWDTWFWQGGSGKPYGITGNGGGAVGSVICLTCHNVHAASTNWEGATSGDMDNHIHGKLLVKDNFPNTSEEGSDMCQDCHLF